MKTTELTAWENRNTPYSYDSALEAALAKGFCGEYAETVARVWTGRTPVEIAGTGHELNESIDAKPAD